MPTKCVVGVSDALLSGSPKATRYNYSADEKSALVQIVAMIKDVLRLLWTRKAELQDILLADMHTRTQDLIQNTLRDVTRHCTKKKRVRART